MRGAVPTPATTARLLPVLAAAAVLAVLVLAGTAARSGPWAAAPPPTPPASSAPTAAPPTVPAPTAETPAPTPGENRSSTGVELATEVVVVAVAVLSLGGLALLLGALNRPRLRRRPGTPRAAHGVDTGPGTGPEALSTAVTRALRQVDDQPDAREAVVQAWLLLGAAATAAGTPPRPAETSAEYVDRLAEEQRLPAAPLQRLAGLYREARFSAHPVRAAQRDQARAELSTLQAALAAGPGAPVNSR